MLRYIKGGCVHYGKKHAMYYGHNVTGRCYDGIYKEWGTIVNGKVKKIHLIGHSMGGQTIRMLAQLLANGTHNAPIEEDPYSHELFAGGKQDWIHSITTISTPNQGTPIADKVDQLGDKLKQIGTAVFALIGIDPDKVSYDGKLDHWGISPRKKNESLSDYIDRLIKSSLFQSKNALQDLAGWGLSMNGAKDENSWVTTLPNIYYYSVSTQDTYRIGDVELPRPHSMLLILQPSSYYLGSKKILQLGYSRDWQPNDGLVPTISMSFDGRSKVVNGITTSIPGQWHHVAAFTKMDHGAIIGLKLSRDVFDFYSAQCKFLWDLPATPTLSMRRLADGRYEHSTSELILRQLSSVIEQHNNLTVEDEYFATQLACKQTTNNNIKHWCAQYFVE